MAKYMPPGDTDDGLFEVRTHPCPRCQSYTTRAVGFQYNREVIFRQCLHCHWVWDALPEFRPRLKRRKK